MPGLGLEIYGLGSGVQAASWWKLVNQILSNQGLTTMKDDLGLRVLLNWNPLLIQRMHGDHSNEHCTLTARTLEISHGKQRDPKPNADLQPSKPA